MAGTPTKNKQVNKGVKPIQNEYLNSREVKIYKHRQFEIVEVEKEKIDNIKNAVDDAQKNIGKGSVLSDVVLGFSTTFLGGFIGCIPSIIGFDKEKDSVLLFIFYLSLLLVAAVLFVIYLSVQRNHHVTATSLIMTIKKETDSISNSWEISSNEILDTSPNDDWITLEK